MGIESRGLDRHQVDLVVAGSDKGLGGRKVHLAGTLGRLD